MYQLGVLSCSENGMVGKEAHDVEDMAMYPYVPREMVRTYMSMFTIEFSRSPNR